MLAFSILYGHRQDSCKRMRRQQLLIWFRVRRGQFSGRYKSGSVNVFTVRSPGDSSRAPPIWLHLQP
jgi:hypothetical protein